MINKDTIIEIKMPALSPTMTKGKLLKWHKKIGDKVKPGDILFDIETDKSSMEYEAVEMGFVAQIFVNDATDNVDVGKLVCILVEKESYIQEAQKLFKNYSENNIQEVHTKKENIEKKSEEKGETPKEQSKQEPKQEPKQDSSCQDKERLRASPIAKRLANENEIDLRNIVGSGPLGRIIKSDVLSEISHKSENNQADNSKHKEKTEQIPITPMRKIIANRLLESKITIPHFYLTLDIIMDELVALRQKINSGFEDLKQNYKITINDLFIKVIAKAMQLCPEMNVSWAGDHILKYNTVDISVAVSIDGGLITPIIFGAEKLSLSEISSYSKEIIEKAKSGKLKPSEFQGGSITISNLGMMNIDQFTAIINPPQASIVAIGGIKKEAVVIQDQVVIKQITKITLSCDHRVIDGMTAAIFMNKIKYLVENPQMLFV